MEERAIITHRRRTARVRAEDRCQGWIARWLHSWNAGILHPIRLSITAIRNGTLLNTLHVGVIDITIILVIGTRTFLVALPLEGDAGREGAVRVSVECNETFGDARRQ